MRTLGFRYISRRLNEENNVNSWLPSSGLVSLRVMWTLLLIFGFKLLNCTHPWLSWPNIPYRERPITIYTLYVIESIPFTQIYVLLLSYGAFNRDCVVLIPCLIMLCGLCLKTLSKSNTLTYCVMLYPSPFSNYVVSLIIMPYFVPVL